MTKNQHSNMRRTQANSKTALAALDVRVEFFGFTVGISNQEASQLLIAGIDSESFTLAVQTTNIFFAEAVISSADNEPLPIQPPDDERSGASPAAIVLSLCS
jgi:hypothetical protein